jgi:xylan 1,4-beta-xylosidase
MNTDQKRFTKPWALCVGSERVGTMLHAEYWERFERLKDVMKPRYIRCHGLLCDDLGVVRRREINGKKTLLHNFFYLDQAFDAMAAHGVSPYIEWGFMPKDLASGEQTVFWWQGNVTPPADWQEWAELVTALTRHWIERYGIDEVRQWPFEIWNEPNLPNFWKDADKDAYFKLYETTARAIKAVDSGIKVCGPAICGGNDEWIDDFLAFVKKSGAPLDIFTRHLYAGQSPTKREPEFFYQYMFEPDKPIEELRSVRERIDANGFPGIPLHITEFNTSYHPLCPVHDTAFNAAYLARLLAEAGRHAELLSYWTFSDLFEEQDLPRALFHGGFGLIGRHGILKPTYHLFAFFNRLSGTIVHQDERSVACARDDGTTAIIAWNPRMAADAGDETSGDEISLSVSIPWTTGDALALRKRVSDNYGNPWNVWREMGRPLNPDRNAIEFLKTAAVPKAETAVLSPAANGHARTGAQASTGGRPTTATLDVKFALGRNEVTLIELSPFRDESPSYLGLEDSLIDGYGNEPVRKRSL